MTDKEIIKALECCVDKDALCSICPYKELNQIKETTQNGTYIDINTHFRDIQKLQSENTRLKAERDKAVEDLKRHANCWVCKKPKRILHL